MMEMIHLYIWPILFGLTSTILILGSYIIILTNRLQRAEFTNRVLEAGLQTAVEYITSPTFTLQMALEQSNEFKHLPDDFDEMR